MIKYKKVYITFFDYDVSDMIICEMCQHKVRNNIYENDRPPVLSEAVDIHHISPRGHSKCDNLNEIPNLVALCRACHCKAESDKSYNKQIQIVHLKNIIKKLEQ